MAGFCTVDMVDEDDMTTQQYIRLSNNMYLWPQPSSLQHCGSVEAKTVRPASVSQSAGNPSMCPFHKGSSIYYVITDRGGGLPK